MVISYSDKGKLLSELKAFSDKSMDTFKFGRGWWIVKLIQVEDENVTKLLKLKIANKTDEQTIHFRRAKIVEYVKAKTTVAIAELVGKRVLEGSDNINLAEANAMIEHVTNLGQQISVSEAVRMPTFMFEPQKLADKCEWLTGTDGCVQMFYTDVANLDKETQGGINCIVRARHHGLKFGYAVGKGELKPTQKSDAGYLEPCHDVEYVDLDYSMEKAKSSAGASGDFVPR